MTDPTDQETASIQAAMLQGLNLILSTDAQHVVMRLETSAGQIDIAAKTSNLGALVREFLKVAGDAGDRLPPQLGVSPDAAPVTVDQVQVARQNEGSRLLLTLGAGPLSLTFAVERDQLMSAVAAANPWQ
jgi:hypothetical protein